MAQSSSSAYLKVSQGPDVGRTHPLGGDVTLGRVPSCQIVLSDPAASRKHARITKSGNDYFVEDLQSANHTFVNDQQVTRAQLRDGDRIRICRLEFVFSGGASGSYGVAGQSGPRTPSAGVGIGATGDVATGAYSAAAEIQLTGGGEEDVEQSIIHSMLQVEQQDLAKDLISAQRQDEIREVYERMEVINEVGNQISTILDLDELLQSVMDRLFDVFPAAERGFILLVESERKKLIPRVIKRADDQDTSELQISKTIVRKSLTEKKAILISDAAQDDRFEAAVSVMKFSIRSMMCVPLICHNEVLGIISIDTTKAGKKFKDGELKLLTAIASPIATAIKNAQLVKEKEKEIAARTNLQRYFSPALVDKIVGGELSLDGERREGIAFFSDMVGFTAMSNRLTAEEVVSLLNSYFERMIEVLFRHNATIDKFSGDAIMAVWGAPEAVEGGPWHSVQAALEMQNGLHEFNCGQRAAGRETIEMGIGLNHGSFIAGNMGASAHNMVNYTIIGDDVNLAARIEAKASPSQVMISESAFNLVKEHVCAVSLPPIEAKGMPEPITIYSIRGVTPIEDPDSSDLVVCLPMELSVEGQDAARSFFVFCEQPGDGLVFTLLTPLALQPGQTVQCAFRLKEMPNLGPATATVIDVQPYEQNDAIPQLAKVKITDVSEELNGLLTVGETKPTVATWEQMARGK